MTQQPNPPLGGDEVKATTPNNLGWFSGLARKHGHHVQADWLDAQIAAPALPVKVREKIARAASDIIFLRKDHPGKTERFYAEEAVARAREVLSTITGDA